MSTKMEFTSFRAQLDSKPVRLGLSLKPKTPPTWSFAINLVCRCYPEGFAKRLLECFQGRRGISGHMRHKHPVNTSLTDRELFERMALTDPWIDASMCEVWKYLYNGKHVAIPDSWATTMDEFDKQLTLLVFW